MPEWVLSLIISCASVAITTVIGFLIKRYLEKYFEKKDKEAKEKEEKLAEAEKVLEEKKTAALEEIMNRVVERHTDPIDQELIIINDKINKVADGTLDVLRDKILSSYYKCLAKGYRTEYDIANVDHMNKDYLALDGNTFVAECVAKFKNIPTEKEYQIEVNKREAEAAQKKKKTSTTKRKVKSVE